MPPLRPPSARAQALAIALFAAACTNSQVDESDATSAPITAASDPSTSATSGGDPATSGGYPATSGDAPTTSGDAPTSGGQALECGALPLCERFEGDAPGGPPDPGRWSVVSPNCAGLGTLAIDDQVAHTGSRSLRVDGGGGYCDHVFIANEAAVAGLAGGVVHARFFVRFGAPLGAGHVTFVALRDGADGGRDLRMGGQSEVLMWNRESDDATLPVLSPTGVGLSVTPSAGAWHCVEFMVDQEAGSMSTWVDGVEVAGLHLDGEPTPDVDQQWHQEPMWRPSLGDLRLGWESYAGQTMTLWIDDVALGEAPIGCG